MLPFAAKERLRRQFAGDYDIEVTNPDDGQVHQVTLSPAVVFARTASDITYPSIGLRFGPQAILRSADQPLSEVIRDVATTDPTVAYERYLGERVYDELTLYVAVKGDHSGIPGAIVAEELTTQVYNHARFGLDHLNQQGPADGEWPVLVRPLTAANAVANISDPEGVRTTDGAEDTPVYRYAMDFAVNYTASVQVLVDAVEEIEVDFDLRDVTGHLLDGYGQADYGEASYGGSG